jgi:hypothetical protein
MERRAKAALFSSRRPLLIGAAAVYFSERQFVRRARLSVDNCAEIRSVFKTK